MNDPVVTCDLSGFGYREIRIAIATLKAYLEKNKTDCLGDGLTLNFNTNSGSVFLSDEDYNVAMLNGDNLEQWFYCPECGHEGFLADMLHDDSEPECRRYLR